MNFDQLQEQWQNEQVSTPEISLEVQKKFTHPLEKIRKNMRMEFWSTVIIIVPMIYFLSFHIENDRFKMYALTLVFVLLVITGFYFKKFFSLYKDLQNNALSTKDALKDLMHQFELNKQYYLAYYLAFVPGLVCEFILIFEYKNYDLHISNFTFYSLFLLTVFFCLLFLYGIGTWWFKTYYGKYISQVEDIIQELK